MKNNFIETINKESKKLKKSKKKTFLFYLLLKIFQIL